MTEENKTIGFRYGVVCDTLEKQAKDQGYTLKDCDKFELQRKSVNVLSLNGLITESQVNTILNKLHKRVIKNLEKQ